MKQKIANQTTIESMLSGLVEAGELAGAATLVWQDGHIAQIAAVGRRDLRTHAPVERDTIFRIASMTKPVTTAVALMLHDEGRFDLDEPISTCAPEFARMRVLRDPEGPIDQAADAARPITFRDLLTHRSGLTYGDFHRGPIARAHTETLGPTIDNPLTPDAWVERLAALPLIDQPGTGFHYGHSTDLLGFLIARLDGAPLSEVLERRLFIPLGMRDTSFVVPRAKRHRRAGLCGFDGRGAVVALSVAPGSQAVEDRPDDMRFESGGQGLWSTIDDYLVFARTLIGERVNGIQLLRPQTLALMTSNQLTAEQRATARMFGRPLFARGHGYGMGVAVVLEPELADPMRCRGGVGTVGWPGAYGGWWQADPTDGSVLIFLAHNMVELGQMAQGIGLGAWGAIERFRGLATARPSETARPPEGSGSE